MALFPLVLLISLVFTFAGFDWSANNDLIVSASVDGSIRVWDTTTFICLQTVLHPNNAALLCCIFQPANNNLLVVSFKLCN